MILDDFAFNLFGKILRIPLFAAYKSTYKLEKISRKQRVGLYVVAKI